MRLWHRGMLYNSARNVHWHPAANESGEASWAQASGIGDANRVENLVTSLIGKTGQSVIRTVQGIFGMLTSNPNDTNVVP